MISSNPRVPRCSSLLHHEPLTLQQVQVRFPIIWGGGGRKPLGLESRLGWAGCRGLRMDDPLQERTRRLVTDFLTFCAREPGVPESPPTSVEAELLRSLAARMQRQHEAFFSTFFGYQGNRVELVRQMADGMFSDGQNFNWGRLVLLLTFAGTLLNQNHSQATRQKTGLNNQTQVTRDCHLIVDLLCSRLLRQRRLWLEAHDGWDGFCDFFRSPFPVIVWRRVLIKAFLSCIIATTILYIWKKF